MLNNAKKILTVVAILILSVVASLYLVVRSESAKITTFEKCEKARWLVRSITLYDGYGPIEAECVLKSGKSFVKKRDSSSFGNDQVEKAITDYLLTQKYFSWKTMTDSRNFCAIENLNPTEEGLFPLYVWVRCGEFILQNGKLKELSGLSVPAKIDYPNQLSFYDISKFSYEVPRDGSLYSKEIKTIFPLNVQKVIFYFDVVNLNKKLESTALSGLRKTNLNPASQYPQLQEVGGTIQDISASAKVIIIKESNGNEINLALTDTTIFYDKNNNKVDISFFERGLWVAARGERTSETSLIPEWVTEWYPPGTAPESVIVSFFINPSRKDGNWILYKNGAKAILIGKNLKMVELRYWPTGTGMGEKFPNGVVLGQMNKVKSEAGGDTWEFSLPNYLLTTNFWAEAGGFDEMLPSPDLGNVGYED